MNESSANRYTVHQAPKRKDFPFEVRLGGGFKVYARCLTLHDAERIAAALNALEATK